MEPQCQDGIPIHRELILLPDVISTKRSPDITILYQTLGAQLVVCPGFGMACVGWVGGGIKFESFLAFLWASGSPFSRRHLVGRCLWGPRMILG